MITFRDANAGVDHAHFHLEQGVFVALRLYLDGDLAVFSEFQGVGQEVLNDLADAEVITDKARHRGQRLDGHVSALLGGHLVQTCDKVFDQGGNVEFFF